LETLPPVQSGPLDAEATVSDRTVPAGHDDQERDVWWGAYAARTMLPSFLLCILLTVLLAVTAVMLALEFDIPHWVLRYGAYALAGVLWSVQTLRWSYRQLVCTYRLTTRRLFLERTFYRSASTAIELRHITGVTVERTTWDRWLGVGRIRITSSNGAWVLEGVQRPEQVAATIRFLVDQQPGR